MRSAARTHVAPSLTRYLFIMLMPLCTGIVCRTSKPINTRTSRFGAGNSYLRMIRIIQVQLIRACTNRLLTTISETSTCALDMIIYKTSQAQQNAFIQRWVVDGFGATAFVKRFKRELKEPAILDGDLKIAMKMLDVFCAHLKQTQRAMNQQDLSKDIIAACERQTARGDADNEWDVYARAAAPLECVSLSLSTSA